MGVSILRQRYKIYWKDRIRPDWGFAFLPNEMIGSVIFKLLIMNQLQRGCLIDKLCGGDIHIEAGIIHADLNIANFKIWPKAFNWRGVRKKACRFWLSSSSVL